MDDKLQDAVGYDPALLTFSVYSENFDLIGQQDLTVQAYLMEYTQIVSLISTVQIEFIDPCPDPESVTSVIQANPADYLYTFKAPKMQLTLSPFVVEPPICTFQYSCTMTSGSRTDLCSRSDGSTHGLFDPITGNYEFYSIDMANY